MKKRRKIERITPHVGDYLTDEISGELMEVLPGGKLVRGAVGTCVVSDTITILERELLVLRPVGKYRLFEPEKGTEEQEEQKPNPDIKPPAFDVITEGFFPPKESRREMKP